MKKVYISQKEYCIDGEISFDVDVFSKIEDAVKDANKSVEKFLDNNKGKKFEREEDYKPYKVYVFTAYDDYYILVSVIEKEIK